MNLYMVSISNNCDETFAEGIEGHNVAPELEQVSVQISLDIPKALRKLANPHTMKICKALYTKSPQSFSELQKMTGLNSNILSRSIYEMRANSLILQKNREYYLTKYSAILLNAVNKIRNDIKNSSNCGENIFSVHKVEIIDQS